MRIKYAKDTRQIKLHGVLGGAVFEFNDDAYMKSKDSHFCDAINLRSGEPIVLHEDTIVCPVNAELLILY